VLDGRATLTLDDPGTAPTELAAGDLVLLPHGSAHLMQDRRDSPARPLEQILAERSAGAAEPLAYGGDGPRTSLLCGGFALASGLPENLLSLLPPLLVLDTTSTGISRWLEPAIALLRDEIARDAPGAAAILAKIADVFLAEVVRRYLSSLDLMTATRFRELVGEPPMSYLARVRLGHAAGYLSATDKTVRQIAHMVGYENESSLSKAFRRAFGRAPGEYRRQQLAAHGVRATFAGSGQPALRVHREAQADAAVAGVEPA
jgi:AraC-like DNA-binding protein